MKLYVRINHPMEQPKTSDLAVFLVFSVYKCIVGANNRRSLLIFKDGKFDVWTRGACPRFADRIRKWWSVK